ncbi:hypothetical protein Q9233_013950 [Columba guinea]|nr:hypothetical protein Q9233_013950 [Columba guinea]
MKRLRQNEEQVSAPPCCRGDLCTTEDDEEPQCQGLVEEIEPEKEGLQQEQDPTNLYISNLPVSMDEQELENMLKPFGHVISTRILRDANGVSRGVGFARMESTEKCEVVIQHFNGKYLKTPPGLPGPPTLSSLHYTSTGDDSCAKDVVLDVPLLNSLPFLAKANETGFVYGLESSQKNEAGNHQVLLQCKKWLIRLRSAPTEPLLCKFADGGQKKRQNQSKYTQNGRPWPREGEAGMALTYDPTAAIQNGVELSDNDAGDTQAKVKIQILFLTVQYSNKPHDSTDINHTIHCCFPCLYISGPEYFMDASSAICYATNRCCDNTNNGPHYVNAASKHDGPSDPTDEPPFLGHNRNELKNQASVLGYFTYGSSAVLITLSQQNRVSHYKYMTAAAPMQGTYIPQYTPVPPTAVPIEGVVADTSPQTVASSSQEASGQQQQMTVETSSEHAPAYSYQQSNHSNAHLSLNVHCTVDRTKSSGEEET